MTNELDSIYVTFSKDLKRFDANSIEISGIENKYTFFPISHWILLEIEDISNEKKGFALISVKNIKKIINKSIWPEHKQKNDYKLRCKVIKEHSTRKKHHFSPQWSPSSESEENTCVICYDEEDETNLLYEKGCQCKGSNMYVHTECLAQQAIFSQNEKVNEWEKCSLCLQPYSDETIKRLEDYMEEKLQCMLNDDDINHEEKCLEKIKIAMFFYKKQRFDKTNQLIKSLFDELDLTEGYHFLILQEIQNVIIEMNFDMNHTIAQTILEYMIEFFHRKEVDVIIQQSSNLVQFIYETKLLLANTIYSIQENSMNFDQDDLLLEMYTDMIKNHHDIRLQAAEKMISILRRQQSYEYAIQIMMNIFNDSDNLLDTTVLLDIEKIKDDIDSLKKEDTLVEPSIIEELTKKYDFVYLLFLNKQFDDAEEILETISDLLSDDTFSSEVLSDDELNDYNYKVRLLSSDIIYTKMIYASNDDEDIDFSYPLCMYRNMLNDFPSDLYIANKIIEILKAQKQYTEAMQLLMNMLYNSEYLLVNLEIFSVENIEEKMDLLEMSDISDLNTIEELYIIYHLVELALLQNRNDEAKQIMIRLITLLDSHDLSDSTDENNSLVSLLYTIKEKVNEL